MPARVCEWNTQAASGRAWWMALWITKPALCTLCGEPSTLLPSRSILTKLEAVISSNVQPKGLSKKCWLSLPGTTAEMWV